jgi:hypothetical protein
MRLNNHILSNLREADSKKLDDLYASVLNAQEMYIESSDDGDVFAGTEDSYAMEMLEQHLFDAIAYSGFFKDDTDPRIMPVYSKIMDLITSNASISKKDIEDAIKVSGIKEGTNGNAKILDSELTGGGVISFVGEVGNYNFVGDIDGTIEFLDKKFGIDSWEKYTNIEDDAWEGKYGDNIRSTYDFETMYGEFLPEYIPNIGRALKQYAKTIKNPQYRVQYERFGDELLNFKNTDEGLNESAKIDKLNVTNGGWSNNSTIIYGPIKVDGKDYELIYFTEDDKFMCFKPGYGVDKVLDILYGDSDIEYDFNGKKVTQEEIYKHLYKDQVDLSSSDKEEIEEAINSKIFDEETGKTSYDSLNKVNLDESVILESEEKKYRVHWFYNINHNTGDAEDEGSFDIMAKDEDEATDKAYKQLERIPYDEFNIENVSDADMFGIEYKVNIIKKMVYHLEEMKRLKEYLYLEVKMQ